MSNDQTINLNNTLIRICNIYQEIIRDLDRSLDVIIALANDEDITDTVQRIRQENVERLILVDSLLEALKEHLFVNVKNNGKVH